MDLGKTEQAVGVMNEDASIRRVFGRLSRKREDPVATGT